MNNRTSMLQEIDEVSFAITELTLFLDTHPNSKEALSALFKLAPKRKQLLKEFAKDYEPLTIDCMADRTECESTFLWQKGPAPWEGGETHVEL